MFTMKPIETSGFRTGTSTLGLSKTYPYESDSLSGGLNIHFHLGDKDKEEIRALLRAEKTEILDEMRISVVITASLFWWRELERTLRRQFLDNLPATLTKNRACLTAWPDIYQRFYTPWLKNPTKSNWNNLMMNLPLGMEDSRVVWLSLLDIQWLNMRRENLTAIEWDLFFSMAKGLPYAYLAFRKDDQVVFEHKARVKKNVGVQEDGFVPQEECEQEQSLMHPSYISPEENGEDEVL